MELQELRELEDKLLKELETEEHRDLPAYKITVDEKTGLVEIEIEDIWDYRLLDGIPEVCREI